MVGMNHRYRPDVQLVRSFVQSGELGQVDSVRGSWHLFKPSRQQAQWRQRRDTAGGGALPEALLAGPARTPALLTAGLNQ